MLFHLASSKPRQSSFSKNKCAPLTARSGNTQESVQHLSPKMELECCMWCWFLTNLDTNVQSEVKTRAPEISKKRGQITVTRSRTHAPEIPRKRDHPWSPSLSTKSKFTSSRTKADEGLKLMLLFGNSDWNLQNRCTKETGPISIDHALALLTKRLPILVNKTQIDLN